MGYCRKCGKELQENQIFCPACGYSEGDNICSQEPLNYKQFYEKFAAKGLKSDVKALFIVCYVLAGFCVLISVLQGNIFGILDVIIYLVCGILIQATKKWGATLALLIIVSINAIFSFAAGGGMGALVFFVLLAGLMCTVGLKKLGNAFKSYVNDGSLPMEQIDLWNPFAKKK